MANQNDRTPSSPNPSDKPVKSLSDAVPSFVDIAQIIAKDKNLPAPHRAPLYLTVIAAILVAAVSAGLFATSQPTYAFIALLVAIALFAIVAVGILPHTRRPKANTPAPINQTLTIDGNRNRPLQSATAGHPATQSASITGDDNAPTQTSTPQPPSHP